MSDFESKLAIIVGTVILLCIFASGFGDNPKRHKWSDDDDDDDD